MATDPRADAVAEQYRRWVYPALIEDLPEWLVDRWEWFDPCHAHRLFWPDRDYRSGLRILVAGCGAHQAAVLAYTNPRATVVGIDVSPASLAEHERLRDTYALDNLELQLLPIEEVGSLGAEFDLIVSTGVLHHLDDPRLGLAELGECLAPDGVLAVMVYARYGRLGVDLLHELFDDLGFSQEQESVELVKQALSALPPTHPVRAYLAIAPDLGYDAGLVDTFLHPRVRSYTVTDCLSLIEDAGLAFQDWFFRSPYEPMAGSGNAFLDVVARLPEAQRWAAMERVHTQNACHFLLACRDDRPVPSYRIDWGSPLIDDGVPAFRYRCGIDGAALVQPGWRRELDADQLAVVRQIDGSRALRDFTGAHVRAAMQELWRRDVISLTLPSTR